MLSQIQSDYGPAATELDDTLAKQLLDPTTDRADRVTAIGLAADRGLAEHVPTLRQLLQDHPNDVSITVATAHALAALGDASDCDRIYALRKHQSRTVSMAANSALRRLDWRLAEE